MKTTETAKCIPDVENASVRKQKRIELSETHVDIKGGEWALNIELAIESFQWSTFLLV